MSKSRITKTVHRTIDPRVPPSAELVAQANALKAREDIDYSDIPPTPAGTEWYKPGLELPNAKEPVTIRLDSDVLKYFRREGSGYQTRINSVLRAYVRAHQRPQENPG